MTRAVILGQSEVWKRRLWQLSIFVPTSLKNTKCVPVIYASYCFSDYLKIFCSCKDVWEEFRHLKTNISKYKLSSETERNSFHTHTHTHTHTQTHTHTLLTVTEDQYDPSAMMHQATAYICHFTPTNLGYETNSHNILSFVFLLCLATKIQWKINLLVGNEYYGNVTMFKYLCATLKIQTLFTKSLRAHEKLGTLATVLFRMIVFPSSL